MKKIRTRNRGKRISGHILLLFIPLALMLVFRCSPALAGDDGKEEFLRGKRALESKEYTEAVKSLSLAEKKFPLLGDYALSLLAEAYHRLGEHSKALETIRKLTEKYPDSPLTRKARTTEIREASETSDENLQSMLDQYLGDYPDDDEIDLLYANLLKEKGDAEKAAVLYKGVYLRAGSLSSKAFAELKPADIASKDYLDRASNLMKRYEFRSAEKDLHTALAVDDGKMKEEILGSLGHALFRQREYLEAASVYEKIGDTYSTARSLYRAGDKERFDKTLNKLIECRDSRAGSLLVAVAGDKWRDGDLDGALESYNQVLSRYPSESEDALWGMGWAYYVSGQHEKSARSFSKLYADYGNPKYLYWQARSIEEAGGDANDLYRGLADTDNNFYAVLAALRSKKDTGHGRTVLSSSEDGDIPADSRRRFERVDALVSLGMKREAAREILIVMQDMETRSELLYAISTLEKLGEYRSAMRFITRLPYTEKLHRFWYPLAFREDVEAICSKHDMDSLVVLSVMREESRFDADARSAAGAWGLMQIMPKTAYRLDKELKLGIRNKSQLNDVRTNISLGAYYLKSLLAEFRSLPHALAAYNAGETAVRQWMHRRDYKSVDEFIEEIPYGETRNYVKKVITSYAQYKKYFETKKEGGPDLLSGKL